MNARHESAVVKGDRTTNGRDERAFQEFVEAYGDRALRFAFVTLRSRPDAEDVTQEAFMRLWRHTVRRGVDTLTPALLYHTVTNLCRDRMRHAKRHPEDPTDFLETPHPAVDDRFPDPKPSLVEAVMQLAPPERQCVLLFYYMDRSLKDTARVLGVSEQVVKTRLYRARQRLKNQLEPLWKEGSL